MNDALSNILTTRGFVHQLSNTSLEEITDREKRTLYLGVDPTASSLHLGHLVTLMLVRHFADNGHAVILVVGGGTGMIGDPRNSKERPLLDADILKKNTNAIAQQVSTVTGIENLTVVNNYDWLSQLTLIEFLRDTGKHFTVGNIIKKEAITARMHSEEGISYTEFSYPLLQAYDYLHLHTKYGCDLQVGGSDQWGNIIAGVDLIRRKTGNTVHAMTAPLIVDKTTGKKFGKSEGNAVWLDPIQTSPYSFYQFWVNVSDTNVIDYLKIFTLLPLKKIQELENALVTNPAKREAQQQLAREVTTFIHGKTVTEAVEEVAALLFAKNQEDIQPADVKKILAIAPVYTAVEHQSIADILVATKLVSSQRDARECIEHGAISLGTEKIKDPKRTFQREDVAIHGIGILRRGKKSFVVLAVK